MLVPCQASELVFEHSSPWRDYPAPPLGTGKVEQGEGESVVVRFGRLYGNATHPSNCILCFPT